LGQISQGVAVNDRDKNGSTPLMHTTWHASSTNDGLKIMALLVEAGADPNVRARARLAPGAT
jgi:ankyrin repeat protein